MEPLLEYPATLEGGILIPDYKITAEEFEPRLATSWRFTVRRVWHA